MPKPQPQAATKVKSMTLTTRTTKLGDDCVQRVPPRISEHRANVDIVRLTNGNPAGSGKSITVTIDPTQAANLFDPVPDARIDLDPGASVEWHVKTTITSSQSIRFQTDPDNCEGHDQGDVVIIP